MTKIYYKPYKLIKELVQYMIEPVENGYRCKVCGNVSPTLEEAIEHFAWNRYYSWFVIIKRPKTCENCGRTFPPGTIMLRCPTYYGNVEYHCMDCLGYDKKYYIEGLDEVLRKFVKEKKG